MTDRLDHFDEERFLRQRLAEGADEPADAAFVAKVSQRVARRRLAGRVVQGIAGVTLVAAAAVLTPVILPAAAWVASAPATYAPTMEVLLASPIGVALSAAVASLAVARLVTD